MPQKVKPSPQYAYCETLAAYKPHIRILSAAGFRPHGGADTLTLCGLQAAWDLKSLTMVQGVHESAYAWGGLCRKCRKKFEEERCPKK